MLDLFPPSSAQDCWPSKDDGYIIAFLPPSHDHFHLILPHVEGSGVVWWQTGLRACHAPDIKPRRPPPRCSSFLPTSHDRISSSTSSSSASFSAMSRGSGVGWRRAGLWACRAPDIEPLCPPPLHFLLEKLLPRPQGQNQQQPQNQGCRDGWYV